MKEKWMVEILVFGQYSERWEFVDPDPGAGPNEPARGYKSEKLARRVVRQYGLCGRSYRLMHIVHTPSDPWIAE